MFVFIRLGDVSTPVEMHFEKSENGFSVYTADYDSYVKAQKRVNDTYLNKKAFNKMSLMNIANAGFFSADRAVKEYADRIWTVKPIHKL